MSCFSPRQADGRPAPCAEERDGTMDGKRVHAGFSAVERNSGCAQAGGQSEKFLDLRDSRDCAQSLVAAAFLTREAVGCGDGLLVCVTGLYLGMWENISLLLAGTAVCALVMALGLMLGKVRRKDRFPLVPFLLMVYAGRLLV